MEDSSSEEEALARRIAKERKAAGKRRVSFSVGLRRQAAALAETSLRPRGEIAATLGLSRSLLQRWVMAEQGVVRPKRGKINAAHETGPHKAELQRVAISGATTDGDESLQLVFPSGARLAGLTLAQIRSLLGVSQ